MNDGRKKERTNKKKGKGERAKEIQGKGVKEEEKEKKEEKKDTEGGKKNITTEQLDTSLMWAVHFD